jgi:hypothetical protein
MSKYNARVTYVDGIRFASKAEARRYTELKLLERAGEITGLKLQPKFEIHPAFRLRGKRHQAVHYIGDFEYYQKGGFERIVEDVKGHPTDLFKLKAKMFMCRYPHIELRIVK